MISRGFKKFIRKEKARWRRDIIDSNERQQQIDKLYERFNFKPLDNKK